MAPYDDDYFQPLLTREESTLQFSRLSSSVMGQPRTSGDTRLCQARRCVTQTEVGGTLTSLSTGARHCVLLPLLCAKTHAAIRSLLFLLDMARSLFLSQLGKIKAYFLKISTFQFYF